MLVLAVKALEGGEDEAQRFMSDLIRGQSGLPEGAVVFFVPPRVELQRMTVGDIERMRDELNTILVDMEEDNGRQNLG